MMLNGVLLVLVSSIYIPGGFSSNLTIEHNNLPEIHEGEKCEPGKSYRLHCNTCHCTKDNQLMCTKMACLTKEDLKRVFNDKPVQRSKLENETHETKTNLNVPKADKSKDTLPNVPAKKCTPGMFYKKGCKKCFCRENGKAECTEQKQCKQMDKVEYPEEIYPEMPQQRFKSLNVVSHLASKCEPGGLYKLDCNFCLCNSYSNLFCTLKLCMSFSDVNRLDAQQLKGKPCDSDADINLGKEHTCLECQCVNKKMKCAPIDGCVPAQKQLLRGRTEDLDLKMGPDGKDDPCIPNMVYRDKCNKCYCQPDGSLRCTAKNCLNYQQAQRLQKQRELLEAQGL